MRPNDQLEMDRLLIMHTVITTAIGGLYRAPIETAKPQRILDVGTGNGVCEDSQLSGAFFGSGWARWLANVLPYCRTTNRGH